MTTTSPPLTPPRTRAKLRSRRDLKDAMYFNRLNVPQLAAICGRPAYVHTISHLHAGTRNTCSPHLARRIEEALRLHPGALFALETTSVNLAAPTQMRGRRAA